MQALNKVFSALVIGGCCMFVAPMSGPVQAQSIQFSFGTSTKAATQVMKQNGYSEIEIYKKGLKSVRAYACKDNVKYDLKIGNNNRIRSATKVGLCKPVVTAQVLEADMAKQGFERIAVEQDGEYLIATGCKNRKRVRLVITQFGEFVDRKSLGACIATLSAEEIVQLIEDAG